MPAAATLARAELGELGAQLGRGAQAIVYELPGLTIDDVREPLVYKEYREVTGSPNDIRRIVANRLALDPAKRAMLDKISAWPLRVVEEDGELRGILMRKVPDSFMDSLVLPGSGRTTKQLREIQNLFIDPALAKWLGRPVPDTRQRLRICRDFAAALTFFHTELSIAFGDINARNELYRLDQQPTVLFIDCDGVRRSGEVSGNQQLNAPDWVPPNNEPLSQPTDLYKLGLFILRCLSPGPNASTRLDPEPAREVLGQTGFELLERALGTDPRARPTARAWQVHLSRLIGEPIVAPVLLDARLAGPWVLRGQPVDVHWTATDALTIEVRTAQSAERVDGSAGEGVARVFLDSSFVLVIARNDIGEDVRRIGPVQLVDVPRQVPLPIPTPYLRWPSATALLPPYLPTPPPMPRIGLPAPVIGPLDLIGAAGADPGPFLPPVAPPVPPFDPAAMIMNGPRLDFGHELPGITLPDLDQSSVDIVDADPADEENPS